MLPKVNIYQIPKLILKEQRIKHTLQLRATYSMNDFFNFYRLFDKSDYLTKCLLAQYYLPIFGYKALLMHLNWKATIQRLNLREDIKSKEILSLLMITKDEAIRNTEEYFLSFFSFLFFSFSFYYFVI